MISNAMLEILALMFSAATQATPEIPVPEGHRPFGAPVREDVLEGWETFVADIPAPRNCEGIGQPMIRPLNPPHREEGVAMLAAVPVRELSDGEAARLLGVDAQPGRALASTLFEDSLTKMRARKYRAEVERRDSWSVADEQELARLVARFETGDHNGYRPYLVRAVSKFGDGHDGAPTMYGDLCDGDLHLQTLVFSYTIPPSERVPAIVFLPRAPERVIASVMVAW